MLERPRLPSVVPVSTHARDVPREPKTGLFRP